MRGSSDDPTGALLLGIGFGAFLFVKGFRTFREYKVVSDTPRMPIRSLAMGLAHVRGKAESEKLLTSPVTRTTCCFYRVNIERWESGRDGGWKHHATDSDGLKFYIQDDTGRVLINSDAAQFDLPSSPERIVDSDHMHQIAGTGANDQELLQYIEYSGGHQFVNRVQHWLDKKGTLEDPRREQGRQALMQLLQNMPALGQSSVPMHTAALQQFLASAPALADPEKQQHREMMIEHLREMEGVNLPIPMHTGTASGRYRVHEFLILPGEEYNVTGTCAENPACTGVQDRNMIAKGQNEKTFLISWQSERDTQKGLRKSGVGMIFGGAALLLVCLFLLLAHLHML